MGVGLIEMEAASKRNFLGKSLNKGLIGRGLWDVFESLGVLSWSCEVFERDLGVARSLRGSPRSEFCSNFKSFDRLGWLRGLELRGFTGF